MITRVKSIKCFGIFRDFAWTETVPKFRQLNLIYGWNYSGKTTLSRIFRCFERQELHGGYTDAKFEIEDRNGDSYDQSSLANCPHSIRVFNSDYVRRNIGWEIRKGQIEQVLILGEVDKELRAQLELLEDELPRDRNKLEELKTKAAREEERLESALTDAARPIRDTLPYPNYRRLEFERDVKMVAASLSDHQLSEGEAESCAGTVRRTKPEPVLDRIEWPNSDFRFDCGRVERLLKETASGRILQRLRADPAVESWVREGTTLHRDVSVCLFCGNQLPEGLIDRLDEHFSVGYERLKTEIASLMQELEFDRDMPTLPDEARFDEEFREGYAKARRELKLVYRLQKDSIAALLGQLRAKQTRLWEPLRYSEPLDHSAELDSAFAGIDLLIGKHNDKSRRFEEQRIAAREKYVRHRAAEFAESFKYVQVQAEIGAMRETIPLLEAKCQDSEVKRRDLIGRLSEAEVGAAQITNYLHSYFGTNEIAVEVSEESSAFKVTRSGHPAEDLSEGEKTAIAFSHFLVSLRALGSKLSDTIVFIDDPVSSLDCNHLYHTYALIKRELGSSKQLFISTHNFEFFNRIKEWFQKKNDNVSRENRPQNSETKTLPCGFFMVEARLENGARTAHILELEKTLREFKSEYHFLFSQLSKLEIDRNWEYQDLYTIGNIARRFFEIFINFKIPRRGDLRGKIQALKIDENKVSEAEQEKAYRLVNEFSHGSDPTSSIEHKDKGEIKDAVKILLNMVKEADSRHFKILKRQIEAN